MFDRRGVPDSHRQPATRLRYTPSCKWSKSPVPLSSQPDISVYSPDHKLQLVVEVKGTPRSDARWAAKLRRNLWLGTSREEDSPPDFQADTETALRRYRPRRKDTRHLPISESGLELAVLAWLSQMTQAPASMQFEFDDAVNSFLTDSGLAERVRDGTVSWEAQEFLGSDA